MALPELSTKRGFLSEIVALILTLTLTLSAEFGLSDGGIGRGGWGKWRPLIPW